MARVSTPIPEVASRLGGQEVIVTVSGECRMQRIMHGDSEHLHRKTGIIRFILASPILDESSHYFAVEVYDSHTGRLGIAQYFTPHELEGTNELTQEGLAICRKAMESDESRLVRVDRG